MSDDSIIYGDSNINNDGLLDIITSEVVDSIKSISDLWSLARMTRDVNGDSIWEVLYQMGYNPVPFDNLGYNFDYGNFKMLYIPMKKGNRLVRFALPKLASVGIQSKDKLMESVNTANSLVTESKFTIMDDDVWLIHERIVLDNEDYYTLVEHIVANLKSGAELFHKIS